MNIQEVISRIKVEPFIGGKREAVRSKGELYKCLNPANGELVATLPLAGKSEMEAAIVSARKAFNEGPWPKMAVQERAKILSKFAELISKEAEFLGTVESLNVGKLLEECITHDCQRAAANIRFFAGQSLQWQDEAFFNDANFLGRKIKTLSVTKREPIGVAGLIVPWNSPIMLATWKIGPCLASGNSCVVKPSPWASLSILQLGELANQAGIPEGVLNIVPAGIEGGEALVSHTAVDRISFTGSVPVGKIVNQTNARVRMAPISLELGGKSPSIVFMDADLDLAVKGVARGIFRSQGQSCVAGSRLILEQGIYSEFMTRLVDFTKRMKIGSQLNKDSEIGPLITREHLERVEKLVATGKKEGGKILFGGGRPAAADLKSGCFLEPTIFDGITPEMTIFKEEIFGPVLTVVPFKDREEALTLANSSCFGLSSSVWTSNYETALWTANRIASGMVWINSHFVRDLRAPFGGVKESGIGSEGGHYSLEFYTKPKMICMPWGE